MDSEDLKQYILRGQFDQINLFDMKNLKALVPLIKEEDSFIRNKAKDLLFSASVIPIDEIINVYTQSMNKNLENIIIDQFPFFIPTLHTYLVNEEYSDILVELIRKIPVNEIYRSLAEVFDETPTSTSMTELAIRTCYAAFADYQDSMISYDFISDNEKEIKKILSFRLEHKNSLYKELVLKTVCVFPELASLIEKEIKSIILKSENKDHVIYATTALMNIHNPKNAKILEKRLNDEDEESITIAIIEALGYLSNPKTADKLIEQLEQGGEIAYHATKSLGTMGSDILPTLIDSLKNDAYVPYIVEAMKRIGGESFEYLIQALEKERNVNVRKNIAQCLTLVMSEKYGYEGAIRFLVNELGGKNATIVNSVTQALLTLGVPSIEILIEEIKSEDNRLRKNAVEVLQYFGKLNIEIALDGLLEMNPEKAVLLGSILYLYHPAKEMRDLGFSFAFKDDTLRIPGTNDLFQILKNSLNEINPKIRARACDLLVSYKKDSVPLLKDLLDDPNILVKRKAVQSLRKIQHKGAMISLISAAEDKDSIVAEISTRALGELGDPGVVEVILNNMGREKESVHNAAIYALTQLGPPIINRISRELDSSGSKKVEGIIQALGKMGLTAVAILLPKVRKESEKWFRNFSQVIEIVGNPAISELKKNFDKIKDETTKMRYLLLRAKAGDLSVVQAVMNKLLYGNKRESSEILNILGKKAAPPLVEHLMEVESSKQKRFIKRSNRLNLELIYQTVLLLKEKELEDLYRLLKEAYKKDLLKYCEENNLKTNF